MGKMSERAAFLLGKRPAALPHFDEQNGCSRRNCVIKPKNQKTYRRFLSTIFFERLRLLQVAYLKCIMNFKIPKNRKNGCESIIFIEATPCFSAKTGDFLGAAFANHFRCDGSIFRKRPLKRIAGGSQRDAILGMAQTLFHLTAWTRDLRKS
jgi:hypothetical protein